MSIGGVHLGTLGAVMLKLMYAKSTGGKQEMEKVIKNMSETDTLIAAGHGYAHYHKTIRASRHRAQKAKQYRGAMPNIYGFWDSGSSTANQGEQLITRLSTMYSSDDLFKKILGSQILTNLPGQPTGKFFFSFLQYIETHLEITSITTVRVIVTGKHE